jgi:hypothetical protein
MVNMGNIWDRTTEFLSDNMAALLPIALGTIALPAAVSTVVSGAIPPLSATTGLVVSLLMTLPALWGQLAVIALAFDSDAGGASARGRATRSFAPALAAMLLVFVALAVLAVPIFLALRAGGVDLAAANPDAMRDLSGGVTGFVVLYGIALLVFIAIVGTRLVLMFPAIVDRGGVVAALRRSFALTKGRFWKILGVWVLFVIVYAVAAAAVGSAFGLIFKLLAPGAGPFGVGAIVVALLLGIVRAIYTVLISAFSAKLYRAVTTVREGAATA